MGARFRKNELSSSQDMHGSQDYFFPYTLFLIWVWLFEICKIGMEEGQVYVQKSPNQAPTPHWLLERASLGTLLESATAGRSKCNHLHHAGLRRV